MYNPSPRPPASRRTKLTPLKISLAYLLFGFLWILLSDRIAAELASSEEQLHIFSSIKGWVFITITALLLFVALRRNARLTEMHQQHVILNATHLKAAQTTAQIGSWEQDGRTDELIWSDTVYTLFGLNPETTSPSVDLFFQVVHPDDQQRVSEAFQASLLPDGPAYDITHRILRADGEIRYMHERSTHLRDPAGNVIKSTGTVQDITDLKQAENALEESEEKYRLLVENQSDLIVKVTPDGHFLYVSPSYCKLFGKTEKELIGQQFIPLVHEEDRESTAAAYQANFEPPYSAYMEQRALTEKGWRWLAWNDVAELDENGTVSSIVGCGRDITERKQTELALEESEEKYRALFNNAPLPYQSLSEDGCFLDVNPAWLRALGYDRDEVIGKWFGDFLHPDFVQHFETNFPAFKKRGYVKDVQFRIRHKNGTYRHIEFEGCIGYLPDGSFRQTYCVFMDITTRKVAEEQLAASEERLRLALNAASQGLYDLNVQTGECTVSPEYATMLGYDPATFVETNAAWLERVHPDDAERTGGFYQDYISGKTDEYRAEFRQRTAAGGWLWVLSCGKIVQHDAEGQPLRMLGTHTNIDQRKKAEEQLAASEERFRSICESAPVLINGFDENGRCTLWNEQCRKTFGWTLDEIHAHDDALALFYPDPDIRNEVLQTITTDPDGQFRESHPQTKDGRTLTTAWTNIDLPNGLAYSVGHDITAQRQAQDELKEYQNQLEERVDDRTGELRQIVNAMAERENRMAELKETIESLKAQLCKAGVEPLDQGDAM